VVVETEEREIVLNAVRSSPVKVGYLALLLPGIHVQVKTEGASSPTLYKNLLLNFSGYSLSRWLFRSHAGSSNGD
jgi:hypothetical protein